MKRSDAGPDVTAALRFAALCLRERSELAEDVLRSSSLKRLSGGYQRDFRATNHPVSPRRFAVACDRRACFWNELARRRLGVSDSTPGECLARMFRNDRPRLLHGFQGRRKKLAITELRRVVLHRATSRNARRRQATTAGRLSRSVAAAGVSSRASPMALSFSIGSGLPLARKALKTTS